MDIGENLYCFEPNEHCISKNKDKYLVFLVEKRKLIEMNVPELSDIQMNRIRGWLTTGDNTETIQRNLDEL